MTSEWLVTSNLWLAKRFFSQLVEAHFRYRIWFIVSWKSIARCKFLLVVQAKHQKSYSANHTKQFGIRVYGLVVLIDMTTYIYLQKADISMHSMQCQKPFLVSYDFDCFCYSLYFFNDANRFFDCYMWVHK